MTFDQFLDSLEPVQVDSWWDSAPNVAPLNWQDMEWKYKLKRGNKSLPFPFVLKKLSEFYGLDLNGFKPDLESREKFTEKYNFDIEEELQYHSSEKEELEKFFIKNVLKVKVFQEWINYGYKLFKRLEINPYKIRMAIRSSPKEAMVILGMSNILTYKEENSVPTLGFVLDDTFGEEISKTIKPKNIFPYDGGRSLYRFSVNFWEDLPESIFEHHSEVVNSLYKVVESTKFATWNQEAKTTNSALKYAMFKGETIYPFLTNEEIREHRIPFFTKQEFSLLNKTAGKDYDKEDPVCKEEYTKLKSAYKKIEYWAETIQIALFPKGKYHLIKNPINRARKFEGYLWARIYPTNQDVEDKWLVLTVGADRDFHFNIKIDLYQNDNAQRKFYEDYRGDFYNSPIVKRHKIKEIYGWDELFEQSIKDIGFLIPHYFKIKKENNPTYQPELTDVIEVMAPINKLNTILYGPPGTGKTFRLQDKYFEDFTVRETSLSRTQYLENLVSELTWWQVIAIALLDLKRSKVKEINSHELVVTKAGLSNIQKIQARLWMNLQHYTVHDCEHVNVADRGSSPIFYKDENSYWEVKEDQLEQFYPEAFSLLEEIKNHQPNPEKLIRNFEFVTFHQSFSYEDFVEGIKPKLEEQEAEISYEIKDGIFKRLCLKALADPDNQYAVFIDEINRGNVSAIFGELITLIEDDKRIGEENELYIKLPYSKKDFGVPNNLHIIGTMNTADRSVEALDTALRRRFAFEEIMPQPELLRNIDFDGFNLEELLSTINERIEALLDRDHTIGHSYFIKIQNGDTEALKEAFENKIIPLLQEYFYHDYEKVALILGAGFVERKEGKIKFAKFPKIDLPEILPSYHLKEVQDIETAVRILLNQEDEAGE